MQPEIASATTRALQVGPSSKPSIEFADCPNPWVVLMVPRPSEYCHMLISLETAYSCGGGLTKQACKAASVYAARLGFKSLGKSVASEALVACGNN